MNGVSHHHSCLDSIDKQAVCLLAEDCQVRTPMRKIPQKRVKTPEHNRLGDDMGAHNP